MHISFNNEDRAFLSQLFKPVYIIVTGRTFHFPNLAGGLDMPSYTLPRDHADEPYTLDPVSVTDSEGDVPVDSDVFSSSDDTVVSIDAVASTVHFGTFGTATLSRVVTVGGNAVTVGEPAVFNITPGAVTVSGGAVSFPGLTPDA